MQLALVCLLLLVSRAFAKSIAVGCFRDSVEVRERVLPHVLVLDSKMTTDMCTSICDCRGFPYAGTQFGTEVIHLLGLGEARAMRFFIPLCTCFCVS